MVFKIRRHFPDRYEVLCMPGTLELAIGILVTSGAAAAVAAGSTCVEGCKGHRVPLKIGEFTGLRSSVVPQDHI